MQYQVCTGFWQEQWALLVQSLKQPGPQLQIGLLSDIVMPTTVIKHWCNFAGGVF